MNNGTARQIQPQFVGPCPPLPPALKLTQPDHPYQNEKESVHGVKQNNHGSDEHVYEIIIQDSAAPPERGSNSYVDLKHQNDTSTLINKRLDVLEYNQDRLSQELQQSHQKIVSEISHLKELVTSLHTLMTSSVSKSQKQAAETDQNIESFATNLGHEVFQVGQEIMGKLDSISKADQKRDDMLQALLMVNDDSKDTKRESKKKTVFRL